MSVEALGGNAYFIRWQGTKAFETATWLYMMKDSFEGADKIRNELAQNGTWMNDTTSVARWASVDVYI